MKANEIFEGYIVGLDFHSAQGEITKHGLIKSHHPVM